MLSGKSLIFGMVCALLAPLPATAQGVNNPRCLFLFRLYDTTAGAFGANAGRSRSSAPAPVLDAARMLRMGGCLTFTEALAGMEALPPEVGAAAREPGPALIAPTGLHAGIVTNGTDEARALAFFKDQGLRARSVGAPALGRRIYVGPFATAAELEGARMLALRAGFAYPYPANF